MLTMDAYNDLIPSMFQQGHQVIQTIRGRQLGASKMAPADPSPFMNDKTLHFLLDIANDPKFQSFDGMQEMRTKCRSKWVGRQGLPADLSELRKSLDEYYVARPVDLTISDFTPDVIAVMRWYMRHMIANFNSENVMNWNLGKDIFIGPRKSSSGYFGFTSKKAWKEMKLSEAIQLAEQSYRDGVFHHPLIEWYRSQRNKMRNVFGESYPNLILTRVAFYELFERVLSYSPYVHYHSESITVQNINSFLSSRKGELLASVEFDYDKMDQHESETLAHLIIDVISKPELFDISPDVTADLHKLINMTFNSALVTLDAKVRTGVHNLFSGVFITNGIEDYTTIALASIALVNAAKRLHLDLYDLVTNVFMEVMGDDSMLIVAHPQAETIVKVLVEEFHAISVRAGHSVNMDKQRVATSAAWFCKRCYSYDNMPTDAKFVRGIHVPPYPIDLALNSCAFPETGPNRAANDPYYLAELPCIAARLDNAYGDPAWETVTRAWIERCGASALAFAMKEAMLRGYEPHTDWMTSVKGSLWNPHTSPTVDLILGYLS